MCYCTFLQEQHTRLQSHAQDVQRRSERVEELVTETEPRTRRAISILKQRAWVTLSAYMSSHAECLLHCRHELSLYVHISNISWKLQNADGRIAGTICSPEYKDIRTIDLDPTEKSQFEIINSIWGSIC